MKDQAVIKAVHVFTKEERKVLIASSVGTIFEWYDFYVYGSVAPILAKQFFSALDPNSGLIFALLAFAAGYVARPLGGIIFGRFGDFSGRKYTFLITIIIMGTATFFIGMIPSYQTIGIFAPIILISLRLIQGLALGGEYGGAATYVAEHAPMGRRGKFTGWIQITTIAGLLLSSIIILIIRSMIGEEAFINWGWRIPFLLSLFLLIISVWIRISLNESPAFIKMKAEGRHSNKPISDTFRKWGNVKVILIALFGLFAGGATVNAIFLLYSLFFLVQALKLDYSAANSHFSMSAIFGVVWFLFIAAISDKIGRKLIIMLGMILTSLTIFPIFKGITHFANPDLELAQQNSPVFVIADPSDCHFQFNPTGAKKFTSSCDIAKAKLISAGVGYQNIKSPLGSIATIKIGDTNVTSFDTALLSPQEAAVKDKALSAVINSAIKKAGYPEKADPAKINKPMLFLLMCMLPLYAGLVFAPLSAIMIESFPTKIRYTSVSFVANVGGCFGGLLPAICFALNAYSGNMYYGLWYPVIICSIAFIIGMIFVKETKDIDINVR